MKISFLASHGGSSARAIITAMANGDLDAEPGILVTNNRDSTIHHWCIKNNFPVYHVSSRTHPDANTEDNSIFTLLKGAATDVVVCSGYMKKIGPVTQAGFPDRILNIHPALLPRHGGKGMYGDKVHAAVLEAGESETGATVHLVNEHYDEGKILGQSHVAVEAGETVDSLRKKVQATEPDLYIQCLQQFLTSL